MKHIQRICLWMAAFCLLTFPAAGAEDPFSVQSVLGTGPEQKTAFISVTAGEVLDFSAADLERRMELEAGSLKGVTVTALPRQEQGGLFLDGIEVEVYDYLDRGQLDRLCFAAAETLGHTVIGLLPKGKQTEAVTLSVQVMEGANQPPTVENLSLETGRNIPAYGHLTASDPDGDPIRIQVVTPPKKGELELSGQGFVYQPWHNKTGSDSFVICAVDDKGAYSTEAVVSIQIQKQKRDFYYTDMVVHPSQYAALMLQEAGVYTGQRIGSSYFFEPDTQMSRGEFLMLLITAGGYADTMTPTVNTGLPGDESIPSHLKRYLKKAIQEDIIPSDQAFIWYETPSRAECVVLTARAAQITDVKSHPLTMKDADRLPAWSLKAYQDLSAYRMLDLYDGYAYPDRMLSNSYAADLLWQLYKHKHR